MFVASSAAAVVPKIVPLASFLDVGLWAAALVAAVDVSLLMLLVLELLPVPWATVVLEVLLFL